MIRRQTLRPDQIVAIPRAEPTPALLDRTLELRAITPIYKGSARPDGVDRGYPFRGPSLRGQLRMWWRAVHPTTDVDELRAQEHALFGGIHGSGTKAEPRASRVAVGVFDMTSTVVTKAGLRKAIGSDLSYALWVDQHGTDPLYHLDASARVRVTLRPQPGDDLDAAAPLLERALRAMVLLGGAGARSRRGLGRLWSDLLEPTVKDAATLASWLEALAPPVAPRTWPSVAGIAVARKRDAVFGRAGEAAQVALVDFRSLRGMKQEGRSFHGRDRLPEAQRDWCRVRDHQAMPSAFTPALGMPLLYRSRNGHLQGVTTVAPSQGDRLPSPVHIRPVLIAERKWAAVILVLRPWFAGSIRARNRNQRVDRDGDLDPKALDRVLSGLAAGGWEVIRTGGAS